MMINQNDYSATVYARKHVLNSYTLLRKEGVKESAILAVLKVPRATYHRWKRNYQIEGLNGLQDHSKSPMNKRSKQWSTEDVHYIIALRRKFPLWGKGKLAAHAKNYDGKNYSASAVGRILKYCFDAGKLQKISTYGSKKQRRKFTGYAQAWEYGMKAEKPGELVQVDHMTVSNVAMLTVKHFQAVCPITKIAHTQAYSSATSSVAATFLETMKQAFPFLISSIQVDGGSEFMSEFELACERSNIKLFVLPPNRPQYNGCVERCNGTFRYEFYEQIEFQKNLEMLRAKLSSFTCFYNTIRPHQALKYHTPMQYWSMNGVQKVSYVLN